VRLEAGVGLEVVGGGGALEVGLGDVAAAVVMLLERDEEVRSLLTHLAHTNGLVIASLDVIVVCVCRQMRSACR